MHRHDGLFVGGHLEKAGADAGARQVVESDRQRGEHDVAPGGRGIAARLDEGKVVDLVGEPAACTEAGAHELELRGVFEVGLDLVVENDLTVVGAERPLQSGDRIGVDVGVGRLQDDQRPDTWSIGVFVAGHLEPVGAMGRDRQRPCAGCQQQGQAA